MISVAEVVADADMMAPRPFTVMRSMGKFVLGGFQSVTSSFNLMGPVQMANDKDVSMLPEADRVGQVMAFWATQPIYVTRGKAPLATTYGETPQGGVPGTFYALTQTPPSGISLWMNGNLLAPNIDYSVAGNVITLTASSPSGARLYATWPVTAMVSGDAADILVYDGEKYRVLTVKHDTGSGYWKALGTRMSAI